LGKAFAASRLAQLKRDRRTAAAAAVLAGLLAVVGFNFAGAASARHRHQLRHTTAFAVSPGVRWVSSWGASPQTTSARGSFENETVRNVVFASSGGTEARVRLTNAFGSKPLVIGEASIALVDSGATLVGGTVRKLTFSGHRSVVIPAGADAVSDPVKLTIPPLEDLAVSVYLPTPTGSPTVHTTSRERNYVAVGNRTLSSSGGAFGTTLGPWCFVDAVDVFAPSQVLGTVVTLGDSITDGVQSKLGADARWPNDLARRLESLKGSTLAVVDEGIGGNRVLNSSPCCGVSALARFDRDVLARTRVKDVIVLEGLNDIGFSTKRGANSAPHTNESADDIIAGYEQLTALAHAAGLRIFAGTLTPFKGAKYWSPAGEAKRDAINAWLRTGGTFDGIINFAKVLADPSDPKHLNPKYDSGDHLHPNTAGYRLMAAAVSLPMLLGGT
jgi:lysophospholipase L1-like esterase